MNRKFDGRNGAFCILIWRMDELITLVRTYRFTTGLAERLNIVEQVINLIATELQFFVVKALPPDAVPDAIQEILVGIATGLPKFNGDTSKEFWAWCYRIARNKVNDHHRKQASSRMLPMPPEDLLALMEASADDAPLTSQNHHDLEYALKLLTATKPECSELLWQHYVLGFDYDEIAEDWGLKYDTARMRINRCLEEAKSLVS